MAAAAMIEKPGAYTFSSQPHALQRNKYRYADSDQKKLLQSNLMFDKRVVRGNTYALRQLPAAAAPDPIEVQRAAETNRRALARKRAAEALRPHTPEALEGRRHMDVQTELYLEELADRVEETDADIQTDAFLDRPPTPLFVPAKTGIDEETQILAGELFDFSREVRPILEVLVSKTLEQSLIEVMEEEELAALRSQQRAFEELRNAEAVEKARLEEQERRHREEKERRMKQQHDVVEKARDTAARVAARAFAQSYLSDLLPVVFGALSEHGYFYDPVERDVEQSFMPWLMDQVEDTVRRDLFGRRLLDSVLREVVLSRANARGVKPEAQSEQKPAAVDEDEALAAQSEFVVLNEPASEPEPEREQDERETPAAVEEPAADPPAEPAPAVEDAVENAVEDAGAAQLDDQDAAAADADDAGEQ